MAFNPSPTNLRLEIESAVKYRDKILSPADERESDLNGSDWMEGETPKIESHENYGAEWMMNVVPQFVYFNPKVSVSSDRPVVQANIVEAIAGGLNTWIKRENLADTLIEVAEDMGLSYGVILLTMEPVAGYQSGDRAPLKPCCTSLDPHWFFQDPQARGEKDWRFRGHYTVKDKDDLLTETVTDETGMPVPKYNAEVVAKLSTDVGPEDIVGKLQGGIDRVPRKQVVMYEVYVPETGLIYTMAWGAAMGSEAYLCAPRKAFVPPGGPYFLFGVMRARRSAYPLAPLAITQGLVRELNAHLDQIKRQADRSKNITIFDLANDKLQEIINNSVDGESYGVPGAHKDNVITIKIDGPDAESIEYVRELRQNLNKKGGITEITAGNVTGATATEVDEAQAGEAGRLKFMQRQFRACVVRVLDAVVWYFCKSNNVVFWARPAGDVNAALQPPAMGQPSPMGMQGMAGQSPQNLMAMQTGQPPMDPNAGGGAMLGPDGMMMGPMRRSLQPGMQPDPMGGSGGMGGGPPGAPMPPPPSDYLFLGGPQPGEEEFDPRELQLEIEPYSMELVDERMRVQQMQTAFALIVQAAPMVPQLPFVKWGLLLDDMMQVLNIKDGRKYLDEGMLQAMTMTPAFDRGSSPKQQSGSDTPAPNPEMFKSGAGIGNPAGGMQMGRVAQGAGV